MKGFGEIFHNGKIFNLNNEKKAELDSVVDELKKVQKKSKENIDDCLEEMKKV